MIILLDLGHIFWRNYFGSNSALTAYELTLEQCQWYHLECARTVLCCEGRSSLRKERYPEYKANRPPKPSDAIDSLVSVGQQIATWGVPVAACDGYEADDVIATLVHQAFLEDVQILSNDKDLYSLVGDNVRLVGSNRHVGPADCVAKFGVKPEQIRDWIAMVGDTADNIPGCPNCGPGRARDLLQKFGTLEAVRVATDDELRSVRGVGEKTVSCLRAWDPSLAVELVTLKTDAPIQLDSLWRQS